MAPPDLDPAVPPASTTSPAQPPSIVSSSQPITHNNAEPPPPPPEPEPKLPVVEASAPSTSQPEAPKLPDVEATSQLEVDPASTTSQATTHHNAEPPPPPEPEPESELSDVEDSASYSSQSEPELPDVEASAPSTSKPEAPPSEPERKLPDVEASAPSASQPEAPEPKLADVETTSQPEAPPLTTVAPPSSTKTPSAQPSFPHTSPPQSPSPATNEITNADATDKPVLEQEDDKQLTDADKTNQQEDTNTIDETTCSMLAFLNLKKKQKKKKQTAMEDSTHKALSRTKSSEAIRAELPKLEKKLGHMQHDLNKLKKFEGGLDESLKELQTRVAALMKKPKLGPRTRREIEQAIKDVKMLNSTVPSAHKLSLLKSKHKSSAQLQSLLKGYDEDDEDARLPDLHSDETFLQSSEFKQYERLYNDQLDETAKLCLLCFAFFPKNEVIKKRLMIYWWAGEGFLDKIKDPDQKTQTQFEDVAKRVFNKLMDTRFIEPVHKKRRQEIHSFKILPVVHSTVKILAKRHNFFDYDSDWKNPQSRACLVQPEQRYDVDDEKELEPALFKVRGTELESLETLFNVSKIILDFGPEWFNKLKKLRVLYLGRWQASPKHHVEVESTEFLEGLKKMKSLRFLSLQGISRIFELPKMLSRLASLIILDLRASPNLEVLPKEIGMLKKLTHLDISECYLLDRVPKEIASLSELQVLKGFVVACVPNDKSCSFEQLVALEKLRKLSVTTNDKTFPNPEDLTALRKMQKLVNLRIVWGYDFKSKMMEDEDMEVVSSEAPNHVGANKVGTSDEGFLKNVKKLDLQCYPEKQTPDWLMPGHVKNLEKLYIKGGELQKLSPSRKEDKWDKVEILCLKFSRNLRMEWRDVEASFPNLSYLEKVRCPNSTLFPCDDQGIWIKTGTNKAEPTI